MSAEPHDAIQHDPLYIGLFHIQVSLCHAFQMCIIAGT